MSICIKTPNTFQIFLSHICISAFEGWIVLVLHKLQVNEKITLICVEIDLYFMNYTSSIIIQIIIDHFLQDYIRNDKLKDLKTSTFSNISFCLQVSHFISFFFTLLDHKVSNI